MNFSLRAVKQVIEMKNWARFSLVLTVFMVLGISPSCQKDYHQEGETYYLVAMNLENPYWKEVQYGFKRAVRSLGFGLQAEIVGPADYNVEAQLAAFQEAVAKKPAGILVSPAKPGPFIEPINQAIEQGIPVICIDSDSPESKRITFIGTDNYKAGFEGGELAAKLLKQRGNVIILTIPGQHNLDERVRGYRDALRKYSRIKILNVLDDESSVQKANDLISKMMDEEGPPIHALLCLDASGGEGAAEALYRMEIHGELVIVAMDKNPLTLDWIDRGGIAATISQKPYTMAFYGVKLLDDLHHNAVRQFTDWRTAPVYPVPAIINTGTAIVDKNNLAAFLAALPPPPGLLEE